MGLYTRYNEFMLRNHANTVGRRKRKERPRVQKAPVSFRGYVESRHKK